MTDIAEFRLLDDPRKVYLSPVIDLHDGDAVASSVDTSPSKALVAETLGGAMTAIDGDFTPHSSRSWHYRMPDRVAAGETAGVTRSMSRKGHSPDNATREEFFSKLKGLWVVGAAWTDRLGPSKKTSASPLRN